MKLPLKPHPFQTSEGIAIRVEGKQFYFLYLFDVHHARLSGYSDFIDFSDSDRDAEKRLTGGIFGSDVEGGRERTELVHRDHCLARASRSNWL